MSKLAHSNEETMRQIESDAALERDLSLYRCCRCGLAAFDKYKPCDCATLCGYRRIDGQMEVIVLKVYED